MLVRLYTNAQKVKRIIHQESLWRMLTVGQLTTSFGESCTFYGLLAHQLCLLNVPLKWKDFQEFPHPLIRTGSQCPNWWKRTGTQISIMKNTFLQLKKNTLKDFKEHSFRTLKISFLIVSNFYIEFTNLNGKKSDSNAIHIVFICDNYGYFFNPLDTEIELKKNSSLHIVIFFLH